MIEIEITPEKEDEEIARKLEELDRGD